MCKDSAKMSQKADLNPPVFQFLLCLFGCAKAVDEHSAIEAADTHKGFQASDRLPSA